MRSMVTGVKESQQADRRDRCRTFQDGTLLVIVVSGDWPCAPGTSVFRALTGRKPHVPSWDNRFVELHHRAALNDSTQLLRALQLAGGAPSLPSGRNRPCVTTNAPSPGDLKCHPRQRHRHRTLTRRRPPGHSRANTRTTAQWNAAPARCEHLDGLRSFVRRHQTRTTSIDTYAPP